MTVTCTEFTDFPYYEYRKLCVSKPDFEDLVINHYQFLKWADHGAPEKPSYLVHFIETIRESAYLFPLVVHCR